MQEPPITIRPATVADMPTLVSYAYSEGMDAIPDEENVFVAENDSHQVVGFIRLALGDGIWHVNPIVVVSTWRGYNVGARLMEFALDRCGELRLVSRGSSRAFYEKLGYRPVDWDQICAAVVDDCSSCEMRDECKPCPMAKRRD